MILWLFKWTATGDDGLVGQASYSIFEVSRDSSFAVADTIPTYPPPMSGLPDSIYYASIWDTTYARIFYVDDVGNVSGSSNIARTIDLGDLAPITDLMVIGNTSQPKAVCFSFTIPDTEQVNYWIRQFDNGIPVAKTMHKWPGFGIPYEPKRKVGVRDSFVLSISAVPNKEYTYILYRDRNGISSRSSNRAKLWVGLSAEPNQAIATEDTTLIGWVNKGRTFNEGSLGKVAFYNHAIWDTTITHLASWRDIQLRYYWQIFRIYGYVYLP